MLDITRDDILAWKRTAPYYGTSRLSAAFPSWRQLQAMQRFFDDYQFGRPHRAFANEQSEVRDDLLQRR